MFNTLIESKPVRQRGLGGTAVSILLHAVIITLAVYVTAHAGQKVIEKNREEKVDFVQTKPKEPPPPETPKPPPPKDVVMAPPPPKGFQVLTAPINIPDKIPDVDLSKAVTDEKDFSGKGVAGGKANGVAGGTPTTATDQPYFEFQVEKPALAREGNPIPKYPSMLESSRVEGEVLAQFVVDTNGRADMSTFKILQASNQLFGSSLKASLPSWRFYPAEAGGRKVKQIVQLPLKFVAPNH